MHQSLNLVLRRLPRVGAWVLLPVLLASWYSAPVLSSLHELWWTNLDFSHGYLTIALVLYLVVTEVQRGSLAVAVPSWVGFGFLVVLVVATWAAIATGTVAVAQVTWLLSIIAAIWALAGWSNAKSLSLPIGYLFIALTVWSYLIEPMRRLTVFVVSMWIRLFGLPAFIEGNLIHVPSGTFEVQGGCSGLRYSLVALALALFVSLYDRRRWQAALLLTACAVALAQVANWVRVFTTVAVGLYPTGSVAQFVRDEHTLFGWLLFLVFMVPIAFLNRVLQANVPAPAAPMVTMTPATRAMYARPILYFSCALFTVSIWLNHLVSAVEAAPTQSVALQMPSVVGWRESSVWGDERRPVYIGASAEGGAWYDDGVARVGVYIANFVSQGREADVAARSNQPAGNNAVVLARSRQMSGDSAESLPFREFEVSDPGWEESRLVWVGLRVGGQVTASSVMAKVLKLPGVMGGRSDGQVLVLTAECSRDCSEARSWLSRFAADGAQRAFLQAERSQQMLREVLNAGQSDSPVEL